MPPIPQTKTYRWMGWHAQELEKGGARPWVEPGGFIDLSDADYNNAHNTIVQDKLVDITTFPPDVVVTELTSPTTTEDAGEEVKT